MAKQDLYCTGTLFRKQVGKYTYWTLSHAGQTFCPLHDNFNSVGKIDEKTIPTIKMAIDANPEPNKNKIVYDNITIERPGMITTSFLIASWFILYLDYWWTFVLGAIGVFLFSGPFSFWAYTNYLCDTPKYIEAVVLRNQYKKEQRAEQVYRFRVWLAANWQIKRAVSHHLGRIGFAHISANATAGGLITGGGKVSVPRLGKPVIGTDSIVYKIIRMPYRSLNIDLLTKDVEREMGISMARECIFHERADGVYVEVMLKTGAGGIKRYFDWDSPGKELTVMHMMPKSAPKLVIPFGLGRGRRFHYGDLSSSLVNHMLIAGSTGGGKSNFLNQMICTWIERNTAQQMKMYMIDLKKVELVDYAGIKHLKRPIVTERTEVYEVLDEIYKEIQRRAGMFQGTARNIKEWNKRNKVNGLPYIVLIIDELAELSAMPDWKKEGEVKLVQIIQLGRAMGVHVVLATQIVKSSVLGTLATANIPCRVCFPVGSINGSMLIVETKAAYEIPRIQGRAIFVMGADRTEVQTAFISPEQIERVVNESIERDAQLDLDHVAEKTDSAYNRIIDMAIDNFNIIPGQNDKNLTQYEQRKFLKQYKYDTETKNPILHDDRIGDFVILGEKGTSAIIKPLAELDNLPSTKDEVSSIAIDHLSRVSAWASTSKE